jgi:peptidoglycan/LPS O-acetylase OafA/YrhL
VASWWVCRCGYFFVISGYLITSILLNDCLVGNLSLARFYQRIARIFPVLFTVALATIAVAAFVYSSQDFSSAGTNLVAASLSAYSSDRDHSI